MSQLLLPLVFLCLAFPAGAAEQVKETKEHASDLHKEESKNASHAEPAHGEADNLAPAHRYDASMPVDLNHGRIGNNGTIGKANAEYESLRQAELAAPGLFAAPYAYEAKKAFVAVVKERLRFFEEAIVNLKDGNMNNKQEVADFASRATPQIEEKLEAARKALKSAAGAGEKDWRNAEHDARSAFLNLKSTYEGMMRTSAQIK